MNRAERRERERDLAKLTDDEVVAVLLYAHGEAKRYADEIAVVERELRRRGIAHEHIEVSSGW